MEGGAEAGKGGEGVVWEGFSREHGRHEERVRARGYSTRGSSDPTRGDGGEGCGKESGKIRAIGHYI